jgi:hypothetical protein
MRDVLRRSPSEPAVLVGVLVNLLLCAAGAFALHSGPQGFVAFSREDGLIEWMQFVCFAALAGILGFVTVDRVVRTGMARRDTLVLAGLTGLVALAALEEISWFQRVLGVTTPDFLVRHNRQGELNLHNLQIGDLNLHKEILVRIIFVTGIAHNLILPLLAWRRPEVRLWVERNGLYVPPWVAAASYLALVALTQVAFDHPRRGEMSETFGAVHDLTTVFAAYVVGVGYGRPVITDRESARSVSLLFAMFVAFLLLVSWMLAAGSAGPAGG